MEPRRSVNISEPHSPPPPPPPLPSSPLQVPPALAKVFFCEELPICGSVREDLPASRVCRRAGRQAGVLVIASDKPWRLCLWKWSRLVELEVSSTSAQRNVTPKPPDFTLVQENPGHVFRHRQARDPFFFCCCFSFIFFVKRLFLNDFLMPLGGAGGWVVVGGGATRERGMVGLCM